ncbi:phage tail protein [Pluralibacter sp.]|uniref:phage tail protein n=1 Tax=Pluralibacter sp. TaxID=1920032 RepID=UPI0025CE22BC|nr:phage tail protein [Pluralibacter sp.]
MNRTDSPAKQPKPFGINGPREPIRSTTPAGDNTASYESGFPPITMTLKSAGGLPPKGQDMNQILYELSALARWSSAGALNAYDASFAVAIGGYPKGSVIIGDDGATIYISTSDSNNNNPNVSATGWLNLSKITSIAALAGGANKLPYFTGTDTAGQTDLTQVGRDIIGKTDIASVLTYLGLGEAAKRGVGTGVNQIPDMSFFQSTRGSNGIQYLPGGIVIQWGIWQLTTVGNYNAESIGGITWYTHYTKPLYTIAFPNMALVNFMGLAGSTFEDQTNEYNTFVRSNMSAGSDGKSGSRTNACVSVTSRILGYTPTVHWLAIGY